MTIRRIASVLELVILHGAALLVPRGRRAQWIGEWRSELWYVLHRRGQVMGRLRWEVEALFFCLGAFQDAVWLRRNPREPNLSQRSWLQSPLQCLLLMVAISTTTAIFFFRSQGPLDMLMHAPQGHRTLIFANLLMIAISLAVLPATTSLGLGEYPVAPQSLARAKRFFRWSFLGLKFALILPIVFCATFDAAWIVGALALNITLIAYVLAFRWALIDQRRRCPVCLRLLARHASIGQPSRIFLEWYGTEYFCVKGHGLLYVPEIATTYGKQRWLDEPSLTGDHHT